MKHLLTILIITICGCTPVRWAKQWDKLNTKSFNDQRQLQKSDSTRLFFCGNNGYRYSQAQGWAYFDFNNNFKKKIEKSKLYHIKWIADSVSLNGVAFLLNEDTFRVLIKFNRFALRVGNLEQINVQIEEIDIYLELPLFVEGVDLDNQTIANANVDGSALIYQNSVRKQLAESEIKRVEKDRQRKIINNATANDIKTHLAHYLGSAQ